MSIYEKFRKQWNISFVAVLTIPEKLNLTREDIVYFIDLVAKLGDY